MNPIPCCHCGRNFMRPTTDPEAPKLCNSCAVREEQRKPKEIKKMDEVGILIQCPKALQIEIEEICINQGIDFTRYFLQLHNGQKMREEREALREKEHKEKGGEWVCDDDEKDEVVETENLRKTIPKKGGRK